MPRYINRVAKKPTSFRFPEPVWEMLRQLDVEMRTYNVTQCVVRLISEEWQRRHPVPRDSTVLNSEHSDMVASLADRVVAAAVERTKARQTHAKTTREQA